MTDPELLRYIDTPTNDQSLITVARVFDLSDDGLKHIGFIVYVHDPPKPQPWSYSRLYRWLRRRWRTR